MDLEQLSIERLKAASEMSLQHYGQPLIITDSGGKDSSVVKELALRSGIPFEIMHNHTTADAPETVRFIRQEAKRFEDLGIKYTMTALIRHTKHGTGGIPMAWMTKRRLRDEVVRLTYRVAELEERLCPCKQHDWLRISSRLEYIGGPEPMSVYRYICRRCGKEKEELF